MIEFYTETRTPQELEERARTWEAEVAYRCKGWQYRMMHDIAEREGVPYRRVVGWVRWAEREGQQSYCDNTPSANYRSVEGE